MIMSVTSFYFFSKKAQGRAYMINFQTISGLDTKMNPRDGVNGSFYKPDIAMAKGSAYAINFNSNELNNDAYNEQADRTKEGIMESAASENVAVEEKYKILMANTMSPEDYSKAAKEGFDFNELDPETAVTILDKIKSVLVQAGTTIEGYNDDLSLEQLTRITGNSGLANAIKNNFNANDIPITKEITKGIKDIFDQMSEIQKLDESTMRYMTVNQLEPTFENIYMAEHSTNGQTNAGRGYYAQDSSGYYAQKADTINWEQIEGQVKRVVEEAELNVDNEEVLKDAKWIIQNGIMLTSDTLKKVEQLKEIDFPLSVDTVVKGVINAISSGKHPQAGNALDTETINEQAKRINDRVKEISDEAVNKVVLTGRKINIKNLDDAQRKIDAELLNKNNIQQQKGKDSTNTLSDTDKQKELMAKMQLEEIRLTMSIETNIRLLRKGIHIETAPIENVIEGIQKAMREDYVGEQVTDRITNGIRTPVYENTFDSVLNRLSFLSKAPVAVVGLMEEELKTATIDAVITSAQKLEQDYLKAGLAYETLMTRPRKDMGDSIKKAFRNVDDILDEMGLEKTDDNRRAVRILGYNNISIEKETIEDVKLWDSKLRNLVKELNPATVLKMIREKKNPLDMTVEEALEYLENDNTEETKADEKYARFLYKLEHNEEITEEERESFIGIYRLFNVLEKTGNAAIGILLQTGSEMTISNLLSANRTLNAEKKGLDYLVNDNFGGIEKGTEKNVTISDQINSAFNYYSEKARSIYNNIQPEKLHAFNPQPETNIVELSEAMETLPEDEKANEAYYKELALQYRNTMTSREISQNIEMLEFSGIEVNGYNISAMNAERSGFRGRRSLWEKAEEKDEGLSEEISSIQEEMEDEVFDAKYLGHLSRINERLSDILEHNADNYVDVRAISLLHKQLNVTSQMAGNGSYDIPVDIDGQKISMHVVLKQDDLSGTKVEAAVRTDEYGYLTATMQVKNDRIEGAIMTDRGETEEQAEYMNAVRSRLKTNLSKAFPRYETSEQDLVVLYRTMDPGRLITGSGKGISDTRELLGMARAFIKAL